MNRSLLMLCFMAIIIAGCKDKKKISRTGDEPVEVVDFLDFFPSVSLPYSVADSVMIKKLPDSIVIAYPLFTQFVPDSVFNKDFGKATPKIYPLGKVSEKGKETYIFLKAVVGMKRMAYVAVFDQSDHFLNMLSLTNKGFDDYTTSYGTLDKKYQINTYKEKKLAPGKISFRRKVYIYNSAAKEFTLIFSEPNEDVIENVYNPIDTLPQKNKHTGDYVVNKKNFISFRDAKKSSEIVFFVHFEKEKGECVGELKGTARFISPKKAVYSIIGNPCSLEFTFTNTSVVMKEVEGCGAYRGITCFFEGTYPKKINKPTKTSRK